MLTQLDRESDALAALDRAIELRPESYSALQAKGSVYLEQNNLSRGDRLL